jgi:rare lipoprotein A
VTRPYTASHLVLPLTLLAAALPVSAQAATDSSTGGASPPAAQTPNGPTADMTVTAPLSAFVRHRVRLSGTSRRARRRVVRIEQRRARGPWLQVARVRADRKGAFTAVWRPRQVGSYELRARVGAPSTRGTGGTSMPVEVGAEGSGASGFLTVYDPAVATWYGPGFFGNTTACGAVLAEDTVGVAHRELPCGTQVQIAYRGRAIVVPVIDRGPFANGADWDLTQAAAQQLGMTQTSRIGAMVLSP